MRALQSIRSPASIQYAEKKQHQMEISGFLVIEVFACDREYRSRGAQVSTGPSTQIDMAEPQELLRAARLCLGAGLGLRHPLR
jgi:hypothetical protein